MGKEIESITPAIAEWIGRQRMFWVATAPLAADGLINCSPKGMDTFRILGPHEVAYLDLTGSGVETVAHLRENGRIVITFSAFEGPPKIVRLHGTGEVHLPGSEPFEALSRLFGDHLGTRCIVRVRVIRVGDSCGYSVPRYEYAGDRDTLTRWAEKKGVEGLERYREEKNRRSLDGLPALPTG
jgi:hypothetical protein